MLVLRDLIPTLGGLRLQNHQASPGLWAAIYTNLFVSGFTCFWWKSSNYSFLFHCVQCVGLLFLLLFVVLTFNNLIRMWFVHPLFLQNIPSLHIFCYHNCTLIGNGLWDTEVLLNFCFGLLVVFVPGFFVCLPFNSQSSCFNSFYWPFAYLVFCNV